MAALRNHRWSGNVRQLRNVVEATLAMGRLALEATRGTEQGASPESTEEARALQPYREARAEAVLAFEAAYLEDLIERCQGNASEAARQAQMDRPYLLSLLKRHGLR
jgi:DNA-binding NtrC family response regulator